MTTYLTRESKYSILPLILSRTSSRAFSPERLTEEELMSLFEAAHWAPSSYNNQPWRFIYARRGEKEWPLLFNLLIEFNQSWCKDADTLVLVVSHNTYEHNDKPSKTSHFDTGAAWMSLALEAHARNWVAHGMEGFDYAAAKIAFNIPDSYTIEAMIAIGKQGNPETLPPELRKRETPTPRKPLLEVISKGSFPFK